MTGDNLSWQCKWKYNETQVINPYCELIIPALDVCDYVKNIPPLFIFSLFNKTLMLVSNVS